MAAQDCSKVITVTPRQAVRAVLLDYATFTGRSRRSEFWWFTLVSLLTGSVLAVPGYVWGGPGFLLADALSAATTLPWFAVLVRRLHDAGMSGRWLWVAVTGVGLILLLLFAALSSVPHADRYGPAPDSPSEVLQSPAAYPASKAVVSASRAALLRGLVWGALVGNYLSAYLLPLPLARVGEGLAHLLFFGSGALVVVGLVMLRGTPLTPRLTRRPRCAPAR